MIAVPAGVQAAAHVSSESSAFSMSVKFETIPKTASAQPNSKGKYIWQLI